MLTFQITLCTFLLVNPAHKPDDRSVWRLQRHVEERERQLTRAQRELAEARAKVALAQGKRDLAITELRKVVTGYQNEVQWIRDHASWFCDPRDQMTEGQWELAKARVRLAELQDDTATLVAEGKKIVGFHEERLQVIQRLEPLGAEAADEKKTMLEALKKARDQLTVAEKRLAQQSSRPRNE